MRFGGVGVLPPMVLMRPWLEDWLREDIGRGDRSTMGLGDWGCTAGHGRWIAKAEGVITGLPIAAQIFQLVDEQTHCTILVQDGVCVMPGQVVMEIDGAMGALLMGERVALNVVMRLSGVATMTRRFVEAIADLPTCFVDTRKTTPGLRVLEKYASQVGGAINHRMGLDDAVMLKDNHIAAAGGIGPAIAQVRQQMPYPLTIEVETETLEQVAEALDGRADIIMLDNMPLERMVEAVAMIRARGDRTKIEASGNVSLERIRAIAETGVDYISSSAPVTQSPWLDLSMKISAPPNS